MFLIREAETRDLDDLFTLAGKVYFINLPADRGILTRKIAKSIQSFRGKLKDPREGEYIFVLEDRAKGRVIGTSMIIAQHGTPDEPHTYFAVVPKKKVSKSLHMGFLHQVLRMGFMYDGPTEIGGLVLDPEYRGHPEKLGKILSYVRFVYMAARRESFQDEVLSELMPPLNERGESPLWEEIGRKFTNLSYAEADRLSRRNKEFVTALFPEGDIYTCMLAGEAREAIGQVGPDTQPVKKMLESIGFKYRNMIDPFDGGPHYWARLANIDPVKKTRRVSFETGDKKLAAQTPAPGLVVNFSKKGFRAALGPVCVAAKAKQPPIALDESLAGPLGLERSSECYLLEM